MSADNNCHFVGRLVKKPKLNYLSNGTAVCVFDLAVFSYYSKKDEKEKTVFPRFKVYGDRAEKIAENLDKGQLVSITAEYRIDKDKEKKNYYPWFLVRNIRFKNKAGK